MQAHPIGPYPITRYFGSLYNVTLICSEIREYTGYSKKLCKAPRELKFADKWEGTVLVRFAFITKVWNEKTKKIIDMLTKGTEILHMCITPI